MRTPSGVECPFFYGNYFRGRNDEECRLIGRRPPPHHWTVDLCKTCPVPDILRANACPQMSLRAAVHSRLLGLSRRVQVTAFCALSQSAVKEPHVGCGQCHPLPPEFGTEGK
jgi:hypothetical protein